MRPFVTILLFFTLAQLIGVFTGTVILKDMGSNPYVQDLVVTGDANEPFNALFFIGYVLAGAAAMIALIRFLKDFSLLFRLMEFMLISSSSSIVFYAFLRLGLGFAESTSLGIVMGLALAALKTIRPSLKNAGAILATAGVGVIFGISLGLLPVILFLALLAIYDFLSVFATKHMVELAEFVVKNDLAFTVTAKAPAPPGRPKAEERRMDLGTGDMIAPVMLEVSALSYDPIASAFAFVGAIVSMGVFLYFVSKRRMVLPALPPIVFGMVLCLMIGVVLGFF